MEDKIKEIAEKYSRNLTTDDRMTSVVIEIEAAIREALSTHWVDVNERFLKAAFKAGQAAETSCDNTQFDDSEFLEWIEDNLMPEPPKQ